MGGEPCDGGAVLVIDHSYWYATRAAGVASYVLLTLSIVWGLRLTTRLGDRWLGKPVVYEAHRVASIFVLAFIGVHVSTLLGDTYIEWDAKSLLLPLGGDYRPLWVGLGVAVTYLTALVTVSFYVRRFIGYKAWRRLHSVSFATFAGATLHGIMSGSDTREPWMLATYIGAAVIVVFLVNLRLVGGVREQRALRPVSVAPTQLKAG